ncbi:MAG TPA: DUF2845 domain-containing protein, partial [Anaeromyxobacteraceae bacterium]|nr:DUF2845 domain-containing protein [Anaeromyxobacteraceae bacterium]
MRSLTFVLLTGFALAAASPARAEDSLRCDGGIVSIGDSKLDLLGKCGPPTLRDSHRDERVVARATSSGEGQERHVGSRRVVRTVERWTYDHGRNRFSNTVTL